MNRPFPAYRGNDACVFVSYSHKDSSTVYPELNMLKDCGFNVWYDEGIEAGTEWREELAQAIRKAKIFLYFVTAESIQSENCRKEVNFAVDENIPIIAIHVESVELPPGLKLTLSDRQAILKHEMPRREYQDKIIERIAAYLHQQPIIPSAIPLEQDIRYCKAADGTRIAFATTGQGSTIVRCLGWFTHLEVEWRSPLGRGFWERLSRKHRLIRYDGRGIGLSEPSMKFTAETRMSDFEAVLDAAEVDKFALVATSEGTRTALRYAVKNPDRVTHLILCGTAANKPQTLESDITKQFLAYLSMIESGWGKATHQKLFADLFLGLNASPEEAEFFQEMQQCSASKEVATAYYGSLAEIETGFELASKIRVPTLVIHAKDDQITPFQSGVDLAAEIPGARFLPLEGDCHWMLMKNSSSEDYIKSIEEFLAKQT